MVTAAPGWEIWFIGLLLGAAVLLIALLFFFNHFHTYRAHQVLELERMLEETVEEWAHDDVVPDETQRLARLRGGDRDVLVEVCLRMAPSLDQRALERVRAGLKRWGLLDRELANLHHPSPARRADACLVLGRMGWRSAVPALIQALSDPHPLVRRRAIAALGDLHAVEGLRPIVRTLEATGSWGDMLAIMALSRLGAESIPHVTALLQESTSPAMTKGLLQMTAQLGRSADPALVRDLASHVDPEVRVEAVRALGHIPSEPASVAVCLSALDDPAWPTRALAARSLGRLGDGSAVPSLERAMGDTAYWVRHHAGEALAALGRAGHDGLKRRLSDQNPFVRDMATQMLYITALPGEVSR
jgi:HEAT repeat protein